MSSSSKLLGQGTLLAIEPAGGASAPCSVHLDPSPPTLIIQTNQQDKQSTDITIPICATHVWATNAHTYVVRNTQAAAAAPQPCYLLTVDATAAQLIEKALASSESNSTFTRKTDKGSADLYFHYYGMLQHQQNMLQDFVRTGTYYAAILDNRIDFEGQAVCDVGAGSGILSLFAAQAGARVVYAVEASGMAQYASQLAAANAGMDDVVRVVRGKVEEVTLPEKVDVLVSEPMGTLLVNERMLETYLYARDHFLKPGGRMFPQVGRIHVAAFTDEVLFNELLAKSTFWQQTHYFGVDLTCLHRAAHQGYMAQVVVDAVHPSVVCSTCHTHVVDFRTATEQDLYNICMKLELQVESALLPPGTPVVIHGVACWFDVQFEGSAAEHWLRTGPGLPTTHWFQLRCVLEQPLVSCVGGTVSGELRLEAHERQSYDVHLTLQVPSVAKGQPPQQSSGKYDLKEPYYRQLTTNTWYSNGQ